MKSIIISSNASGGGKTIVTLGLMKALKNRNYSVQGFKVGPDYIDTAFHSRITGIDSRNLDLYLMSEEGIKASFSRGKGDFGIVEGVMGLYDGKGIDERYSTYHVAELLNLPIVLVLSPKAQVATLCAEINGIINFRDANIAGVILNNISESYYKLLKRSIEENCKIKVFGYLPKNDEIVLKSRHLGLIQSSEIYDLERKIELCAQLLEKNVDIDALINCFKQAEKYEDTYHIENKDIRIGVARDEAFSFYYKENLELLKEAGEVVFFSPMRDKKLPEDLDFIYFGGGYPEIFAEELSQNKDMLVSIKQVLENGTRCYAECGGLMYLTKGISYSTEETSALDCYFTEQNLVGFFNGYTHMTKRLQNFGYAELKIVNDNELIPLGLKINCHEFHKSCVNLEEKVIYSVTKTTYDGSEKKWNCGYVKNNTLAAYAHVHFFGNLKWLECMLNIPKIG
ncbi:cobyrinic acid A,C-diamide synthase [Clostridium tepidiprofundi DSM 19306]|uniref:Cobyrinate a,c-diamide synthase n=1 Tax=Clostridium tepidiprofundi DSM 19306 TaxID=1121338 RepID=A0A151B6G4_9CLOT|nr:cobyrinate a,c-diamide synthase [Clostridium tepidiprofundi]KYH35518.1 cobyrinic acid A,C-diamide synthase [Clostridium tepidiprofundi DSM 19306]